MLQAPYRSGGGGPTGKLLRLLLPDSEATQQDGSTLSNDGGEAIT